MLTGDMLRRSAARFPNKAAIHCGAVTLGYAELERDANRLANALKTIGLARGAKVAMLSRNLAEYGIVFFGCARSGCVLANISVLYAPDELRYVLDRADVEVLIHDAAFSDKVAAVLPALPRIRTVVRIGRNDPGQTNPGPTDPGTAGPDPAESGVTTSTFEEFIANGNDTAPDVVLDERDPFCMTYTGGTTGRPKGVLCSHRARAVTAHTVMVEEALDERDVVGIVTPLFHVAALNIMFQPAILAGATCTFLTKWSPTAFMDMVETTGLTACFMVPTQAATLLGDPHFDPQRLRTWRKASFAGAPMPDWVQHELRSKLPWLALTQIYGQSEMGVIAVLRDWYLPDKLGSVGRQPYNADVRVVDTQGRDVAPGEPGEVVSRGDNLMLEYYNEPEQTAEFFRLGDEWGWSGDVATIDEDGFITLIDRSKDMIISGGENVYPKEIELVIYELDAVAECAVFGIPDDTFGEVPAAWISLKPGASLEMTEVEQRCTERLARFKRPRDIRFVTEFPKTPIGKIQKNVLREQWRAAHEAGL